MRGRVRLYVPALCRKKSLAESVLTSLASQGGVRSARMNYNCSSLVLEFDPAYESIFRLLLGQLRLMTPTTPSMINMGAHDVGRHEAKELVAKEAVTPLSYPLVLPTVSLAIAFAASPWLRAVNIPLMLWNAYPIAARAHRVWRKEGRLNVDFLDTLG